MQQIQSGDCTINIKDDGPKDGAVVMFGNSLGTDLRVWDPLMAYMPSHLRIVRFDKRGHGLSDCPAGPFAIETLANDAANIADALGLKDITFVGLSIGGLIGQSLALQRPELLSGLVLMDTAAKIGSTEMWRDRIAAARKGGLDAMADAVLERWFGDKFRSDKVALSPWKNMLTRTPLEGYIACCEGIAAEDFTDRASQINLPIMAMAGSLDLATPPDLVKATADLYGAPFHLIENAGHLPCVEKPQEIAKLILDFQESLNA